MDPTISRRRFLRDLSVVTAGVLVGGCLPSVTEPPASTPPGPTPPAPTPTPAVLAGGRIFRNARVITMDPERPEAEAVAIVGDTIAAVGTDAEILPMAPGARVIDVGGRVLLPGFNDAHCHRFGERDLAGYDSDEDAVQDALAGGWTSISELFVTQDRLDHLVRLDEAGRLPLRVNAYLPINYLEQKFGFWFNHYRPHQQVSPHVRIGGVKAFADEAWTDEMAMTQPHIDRPGFYGNLAWEPDEFADLVRFLHDDGWQIATHTAGDAAHDLVLGAYEKALAGAGNAGHRHRIEHCMALRDDQLRRMRDLEILASFQLTWFSTDANLRAERTLDPDRLRWLGRWRDLLEWGVPAVASTDHPYDDLEGIARPKGGALHAMGVATTRILDPGVDLHDWQAAQRLAVGELLPLMTISGAYATFEEDTKGTITAGKLADLVVLDDDPRAVPPERVGDVNVLMTMIGGRSLYCAPGEEALCPGPG